MPTIIKLMKRCLPGGLRDEGGLRGRRGLREGSQ